MSRRSETPAPEVVRDLAALEAALAGEPDADEVLVLLASDLRAEAPRMSAAFAARLDEAVDAGFARESRAAATLSSWRAALSGRRGTLLPALGVAATVLVGAISIGLITRDGGSDSQNTATQESLKSAPAEDAAGSSPSLATPAPQSLSSAPGGTTGAVTVTRRSAAKPGFGRKVEKSTQLTLTTSADEVQNVADDVVRVTQALGGYVSSSSVTSNRRSGSAIFSLRIPSARLDDAIKRLGRLAHVGALSQNTNDITQAFVSAASRLSDARAERRALLRALAKATTAGEIASLRARLRINASEIASYKGQLNSLRRRADFATVDLSIEGRGRKPAAVGDGRWTPGDALHDAARVLEVAAGVALITLAALVPLAALAAAGAAAARVGRRRRREHALDAAA